MPPSIPPHSGVFDIGDVLGASDFGGFQLSADGTRLVLSRYEYVKSLAARPSRILVLSLDEGDPSAPAKETTVFTGNVDGWAPELHEDGRAILFLTDYSGEARPWVASEPDAVPGPVACVTRMASVARWRPGAGGARRGFAFLSFATREEQGFDDPIVWGTTPAAGFRHVHYAFDESQPPRRITDGPEDVYDFAWLPDGSALAVLVAPGFEMERHLDSELRLCHPDDGRVLARHRLPRGLSAFLSVSPAGTHVAWLGHGAGARAGKPDLYAMRLSDGRVSEISTGLPGYVSRYDWAPDGAGLFFPAAQGVRTPIYFAPLTDGENGGGSGGQTEGEARGAGSDFGPPVVVWEPPGFVGGLSVSRRARRVAFRIEGPRTPPCLVVCGLEGELHAPRFSVPRAVTARSARKEGRIPGDATAIEARAPDGRPVDAVVLHPRRGAPGRRPLCVWLHGGPNEYCALSFQPWWQLFVARGFTVVAPNFRGSGSYATERVRWNVGDLGGGDADDVIAAIDAAAGSTTDGGSGGGPGGWPGGGPGGWIDARKIVLFGWSYGAFLAFHVARKLGERDRAAGRPPSVRRIVAGAGVYDWLSHYGQAELRFPWRDYLGGSPLLDATAADARSPVRHVPALHALQPRCEYLLMHGINDGRASPQQSRTMYRALCESGAQASLLLYPREAHVFVEPEHVRDLLDRATAELPPA